MQPRKLTVNLAAPWRAENDKAVVTATLMTQGVRCGSRGCLLWRSSVLSHNPQKWNGVPVALNHPTLNGEYVSISQTPNEAIGIVRNARFDGVKRAIVAEVVVSLNNYQLGRLQALKEVSIGVFSEEKPEHGTWHGKSYTAVVQAYKPDHLAILQGERGACSWEDGCGIRTNIDARLQEELIQTFAESFIKVFGDQYKSQIMTHTQNDDVLLPPGVSNASESKNEKCCKEQLEERGMLPPPDMTAAAYHKRRKDNKRDNFDDKIILMY